MREAVEALLDDYRSAVERRVRRSVDAVSCQTERDFRAMHRAEEAEEAERERVVKLLSAMVSA